MNDRYNKKQPEKIRWNYSRHLEEIADEFRFSDDTLRSDKEIDDRHIIDDLDLGDDDEEKPKIEKSVTN